MDWFDVTTWGRAMSAPSASRFTYRAFVSYSHRDKAWADWLHKALETYRVPSRLVGTETPHGRIPRRLIPIFRDRDELASAGSLAEKVNAALAQSENLIVICSPASAASRWVNEEVLTYKRMGRGDRIFCLIVGGEPNASDMPGREPEECFCPALRFRLDSNGQPTAERTEPIAADTRPGKDGKPNAKLRLIAGMLDVGFDALKQREQRRQLQRMTAITALAVGVMAVTIVLAIFALVSRHRAVIAQHEAVVAKQAAVRRQKQAEGLVGFMLGDLNDKLNQVHRLDIMQAVDDKALAYFDSLPAADATDAALEMRVQALDKIGMVMTDAHGQLAAATRAYQSAAALAEELARRTPGNIERQAAWAESLNMVGVADWQQGDLGNAFSNFKQAAALLETAHTAKPDDPKITSALASTRNNIGQILETRGNFSGAQTEYGATLKLYQSLAKHEPENAEWQGDVGWSWDALGKLALERGQLDRAITAYITDQHIKAKLASRTPNDHAGKRDLLISDAILGRTLALCGQTDAALRYTDEAIVIARQLLAFDPSDLGSQDLFGFYSQQAGGLLRQLGRIGEATTMDAQATQTMQEVLKKDSLNGRFQKLTVQTRLESARLDLVRSDISTANQDTQAASELIQALRAKTPDDRDLTLLGAEVHLVAGQTASRQNDAETARKQWAQARDLLQSASRTGNDPNFLATYVEALLRLEQTTAARPVIAKLNAMGYRTPDFVALLADKHIDYPINAAFQQRLAQITQGDAARP